MLFSFYLECISKRSLKIEVDYYPFGMEQPNRQYTNSEAYRYGFNGKENDRDWGTAGLTQDYGFRLYNPAIAKFLSVDPLSPNYPFYTPYQFAGNMPIAAIDLDGLEPKSSVTLTAGHGYGDPGSTRHGVNHGSASKPENQEQYYAMKFARATFDYLEDLGVEVYLSRTEGKKLPAPYDGSLINSYSRDFAHGERGQDEGAPQQQTNVLLAVHLDFNKSKQQGAYGVIAQSSDRTTQYKDDSKTMIYSVLSQLSLAGIPTNSIVPDDKRIVKYKKSFKLSKTTNKFEFFGPLETEEFKGRAAAFLEVMSMRDVSKLTERQIEIIGCAVAKGLYMDAIIKERGSLNLTEQEIETLNKVQPRDKPKSR